jgi:hypothetical protein
MILSLAPTTIRVQLDPQVMIWNSLYEKRMRIRHESSARILSKVAEPTWFRFDSKLGNAHPGSGGLCVAIATTR